MVVVHKHKPIRKAIVHDAAYYKQREQALEGTPSKEKPLQPTSLRNVAHAEKLWNR